MAEILLVDDNPADVDLISQMLVEGNELARIHTAANGVEAISFLRRQGNHDQAARPALVLLDLNLPCKDGRAVLAEVKADPVLRQIPIVVFSTSQAPSDIACCYELGANCYVSKPGNLTEFTSTVQSIQEFWLGLAMLPQ
jgi:two-component system, chemotaxis family, response regulator Rcp1